MPLNDSVSRRRLLRASVMGGVAVYLAPLGSRAWAALFDEQLLTRPDWNASSVTRADRIYAGFDLTMLGADLKPDRVVTAADRAVPAGTTRWRDAWLSVAGKLGDEEAAALVNYLRAAWGGQKPDVTAANVRVLR